MKAMFAVTVDKPRPDFRVFFYLLFGPGRSHNETVLKIAMVGMIEIENGSLEKADTTEATGHVETRAACTDWLDDFYPDRADKRAEQDRRRSTYCCTYMQYSIEDSEAQTRFKFELFRGEDAC